jgi:hypothetical protein
MVLMAGWVGEPKTLAEKCRDEEEKRREERREKSERRWREKTSPAHGTQRFPPQEITRKQIEPQ